MEDTQMETRQKEDAQMEPRQREDAQIKWERSKIEDTQIQTIMSWTYKLFLTSVDSSCFSCAPSQLLLNEPFGDLGIGIDFRASSVGVAELALLSKGESGFTFGFGGDRGGFDTASMGPRKRTGGGGMHSGCDSCCLSGLLMSTTPLGIIPLSFDNRLEPT